MKQTRLNKSRLLPFVFFLLLGNVAYGTNYYVSVAHGNDTHTGTSMANAWKTLNYGLFAWPKVSPHAYKAGDTLFVDSGTYHENIGVTSVILCPFNYLVITAYNINHKPVLQPINSGQNIITMFGNARPVVGITINGFVIDGSLNGAQNCMKVSVGAHNNVFSNCEIKNAYYQGIMDGGNNNTFKYLHVHDNGGSNYLNHGFYVTAQADTIENCLVDYNGGGNGIRIGSDDCEFAANNIVVRNNVCCFNGYLNTSPAAGIVVSSSDSGILVYNNICYGNNQGIFLQLHANRVRVFNNTVYNNLGYGILVSTAACNRTTTQLPCNYDTIENNLLYRNGDTVANYNGISVDVASARTIDTQYNFNNHTDPSFYDQSAGDFRLVAGSRAIHAGTHIAAVKTDFYGNARPATGNYTVGAMEFTVPSGVKRTTFYVDSATGKDLNPGTIDSPYQRFTRGMSELLPGDTLILGNGTYKEFTFNSIPYGELGHPIVIMAKSGATPIIRRGLHIYFGGDYVFPLEHPYRGHQGSNVPHDIIVNGLTFDAQDFKGDTLGACISVYNKRCVFENCIMKNSNRYYNDIYEGGDNAQIINCKFYKSNCSAYGAIRVFADTATFKNDIFYGNDSGDNIYVTGRFGKYDSCSIFNAKGNGITFNISPDHGDMYNTLSNSSVYNNAKIGVSVAGNYFNIVNDSIYSNDSSGMYIGSSKTDTIKQNSVYKNGGNGISGVKFNRSDIERNFIDSNSQSGISLTGCDTLTIYNNLVYGHTANGIVMATMDSAKIYNNTIADNGNTGVVVNTGSSKLDLINDIIYGNHADTSFYVHVPLFSHNWLTVSGDPKFAGAGDYSLQSISPCIDTGKTLAMIPIDIIDTLRPQGKALDIGAYEYAGGLKLEVATHVIQVVATAATDDAIKVYPVPFSNSLNITWGNLQKGDVSIALYDAAGRMVYHYSYTDVIAGEQVFTVNAQADWPNGMYILQLANNNQVYRRKVLVQHQ